VLLFNHLQRTHPIVPIAVVTTLVLILLSGFHYLWRTMRMVKETGSGPAS
jgi:hypothetical protein